MSDTQRCEPPEHLRNRDGWHWLDAPDADDTGKPWPCRWVASAQGWWGPGLGGHAPHEAAEKGYRYLAPVTPPSTVAALVEALTECADDLEAEIAERYRATRHHPSERRREERDMAPVLAARAALALYRGDVA